MGRFALLGCTKPDARERLLECGTLGFGTGIYSFVQSVMVPISVAR